MKRIVKTLLVTLLMTVLVGTVAVQAAEKDAKAEDILKTAINESTKYGSISCEYYKIMNYKDDKSGSNLSQVLDAMFFSDDSMEHGLYFDGETAWQGYSTKDTSYRKYYRDGKWTVYTNYNKDSYATLKNTVANLMSDSKNVTIFSETKASYTLKAKSSNKTNDWKTVSITINKKSGLITKLKFTYKSITQCYAGSSSTYTVTGGTQTYSHISYCDSSLSLPDELLGK